MRYFLSNAPKLRASGPAAHSMTNDDILLVQKSWEKVSPVKQVATALFWTLETALLNDFTEAVKSAWLKTLGLLSQTLRLPAAAQAI
jgi:hypothetical protein